MMCYAEREERPPVRKVVLELTVEEAVELQRTITALSPDAASMRIKDRVYSALRSVFVAEGIKGGIYY